PGAAPGARRPPVRPPATPAGRTRGPAGGQRKRSRGQSAGKPEPCAASAGDRRPVCGRVVLFRQRERGGHATMTGTGSVLADRLARGTVLGAEGYVFELERRGYVKAGAYVPEAVAGFPDAVTERHRGVLRAAPPLTAALT